MAKNHKPRFCWDSCCFLSWFHEDPSRKAECTAVIEAAKRGDVELYASAFALAECVYISQELRPEENARQIEGFFRRSYIRLVDVNWVIAAKARALLALIQPIQRLDPWDAVHLATALHVRADALHTYDRHLVSLNGRLSALALRICHPDLPRQLSLFC